MEPRAFDELARRISKRLSRRAVVGDSLVAALLAAAGLSDEGLATAKTEKAKRERRHSGQSKTQRRDAKSRNQEKNEETRQHKRDRRQRGEDKHRGKRRRGGDANDGKARAGQDGTRRSRDGQENRCIPAGRACGGKSNPPCKTCCTRHAVSARKDKDKNTKRCACRSDGLTCGSAAQCCSGVCEQGRCGGGGFLS